MRIRKIDKVLHWIEGCPLACLAAQMALDGLARDLTGCTGGDPDYDPLVCEEVQQARTVYDLLHGLYVETFCEAVRTWNLY